MSPSSRVAANPPDPVATSLASHDSSSLWPEHPHGLLEGRVEDQDASPAPVDAWALFRADFAPLLNNSITYRRGKTAFDAEDAAQESWLAIRAFLGPDWSEDLARTKGSLAVIVEKQLTNLRRQAQWRLQESLDDGAAALVGLDLDPAAALERAESRSMVWAAFLEARGRLPEPSYRIIVLRWIEEWTYLEIAESLGMTIDRVRDRHRRAFSLLRVLIVRRFSTDRIGPSLAERETPPPTSKIEEMLS